MLFTEKLIRERSHETPVFFRDSDYSGSPAVQDTEVGAFEEMTGEGAHIAPAPVVIFDRERSPFRNKEELPGTHKERLGPCVCQDLSIPQIQEAVRPGNCRGNLMAGTVSRSIQTSDYKRIT